MQLPGKLNVAFVEEHNYAPKTIPTIPDVISDSTIFFFFLKSVQSTRVQNVCLWRWCEHLTAKRVTTGPPLSFISSHDTPGWLFNDPDKMWTWISNIWGVEQSQEG